MGVFFFVAAGKRVISITTLMHSPAVLCLFRVSTLPSRCHRSHGGFSNTMVDQVRSFSVAVEQKLCCTPANHMPSNPPSNAPTALVPPRSRLRPHVPFPPLRWVDRIRCDLVLVVYLNWVVGFIRVCSLCFAFFFFLGSSCSVFLSRFFSWQGMSVALGVTRVLQYVLQGLFHPARRVREVYWKLYNSLYILGADALTPAYPRLTDDGNNTFRRTHLELFV